MKSYDHILFDLDGTIVDSKPGIVNCIRYAFDAMGFEHSESSYDRMIGPPFRRSLKEFYDMDEDSAEKFIALYRERYESDGWKECKVYDGVRETLHALCDAGKVVALATSKPLMFAEKMMKGLGLDGYFRYISGASADASRESKSDIMRLALKNIGASDLRKTLMVGDRIYDVQGAKEVGVDCAAVLYGYGSKEELEGCAPAYIISSPLQLVDIAIGK